ncbi:MAG TPA: DUF5723 family protein [Bacteroidia bacterium]|jgi:hypothetical protein|nr:DUF5723 family protein [Bacteroidia bacterium]
MKKIITALLLASSILVPNLVRSQIDLGLPSTTGKGGTATAMVTNFEAIGINPSNLGWSNNYKFSMTVANVGLNMQSQALDFATMKNAVLNPRDSFTLAQKQEYANKFATPEGFNMTANVNWLAASVYVPKVGGFAINVRDRVYAHVGLNQNAADFIFMGKNAPFFQDSSNYSQNLSTIFNGCDISLLHYREANIAYGRRLFGFGNTDEDGDPSIQIFGGFGFKLLWGLANIDGKISPGLIAGHSAITSSYDINYGNIQNFTSVKTTSFFNSVGQGTAFDLGASLIIKKKIRFGASLTDVGSITWKDNVLVAHDTTLFHPDSTNTGLPNWQLGNNTSSLFGNDGFMNYQSGVDYKSTLPSKVRFGVGWQVTKFLDIGADVVVPYTKNRYNLSTPYFALGGEVKVGAAIRINAGVSGNGELGWNMPLGVTLGPIGPMEFGLATGDVLTYLSKSKDPNMSIALGFIRVNIDPSLSGSGAGTTQPPTPGL